MIYDGDQCQGCDRKSTLLKFLMKNLVVLEPK
jgi:hypothetical protein